MITIQRMLGVVLSFGVLLTVVAGQSVFRPFRELTFNVVSTKTAFVPLEPIPLKFVLENRTDSPIMSHGSLTFHTSHVKISLEQPGGSVIADIGQLSPLRARTITIDKEFPAGGRHEITQVLSFQLERYFTELGRYKIRASFLSRDGSQTISSKWARFEIVLPTGTNLAAYDYLKRIPDLSMFFFGHDDSSVEEAKTFVSIFPDSAYSDYVRYPLASYFMHNREFEKAREQLNKLRPKENFAYKKEVEILFRELESQTKK